MNAGKQYWVSTDGDGWLGKPALLGGIPKLFVAHLDRYRVPMGLTGSIDGNS